MTDELFKLIVWAFCICLAFGVGWWAGERTERFQWQHHKKTLYGCPSCKRRSIILRYDGKYVCNFCAKAYSIHEVEE